MNLALLSALEKIYFVVCGNLYRNFCLSFFFFLSCLVNYFILQTLFFLFHVFFMSAVHCMKRILFFCFFDCGSITFLLGEKKIPFALFKKIKSDCAICCIHQRQSALYC